MVHKPDLPPSFGPPAPPTRLGGVGLPAGHSPRASRGASVAALRDYGGPNAFAIPGNHGAKTRVLVCLPAVYCCSCFRGVTEGVIGCILGLSFACRVLFVVSGQQRSGFFRAVSVAVATRGSVTADCLLAQALLEKNNTGKAIVQLQTTPRCCCF